MKTETPSERYWRIARDIIDGHTALADVSPHERALVRNAITQIKNAQKLAQVSK